MKRIIKISILSLWMYGVNKSASHGDQTTSTLDTQDMVDRGRAVLNRLLGERQESKINEIMAQVENLEKQIQTMDQKSPNYQKDYQRIDSEKGFLISQLSCIEKDQVAAQFVAELKTKLDSGDEHAVLRFLFSHPATYFIGMQDIKYDEELADKLQQICSPKFRFAFRQLAKSGFFPEEHLLSVCRFLCFAITGMTIQECICRFGLGHDIPHAEFIIEMHKDIRNLFTPGLDLDELFGIGLDAKRRVQ